MRTRITRNTDTFHVVMMTAGACLKKHSTLENTISLQLASSNNDGVTQCMDASAPLETIRFK